MTIQSDFTQVPNEGAADEAGGVWLHGLFTRARAHDRQITSKVTTEKLRKDSSLLPSFITKAADVVENTYFNSSDITQKVG